MGLRSRNKVSANFNMSSMTDIVFLLLIFFMLTSTLVSPIAFYINENKVTAASIEQELKLLINNEIEPAIILHTDKTVAIEHVVKVMDIAYRNKYKIVLATTPN